MSFDDNEERPGHTVIWSIENFSYCMEMEGETIHSPRFNDTIHSTVWQLSLCPRPVKKNYIGAYLVRRWLPQIRKIHVDFEMSIITGDGSSENSKTYEDYLFDGVTKSRCCKLCSREDIFANRKLYLPEDTLTLRCRMWRTGIEVSRATQCFIKTKILVERNSFTWNIENLSSSEPLKKKDVHFDSNNSGYPTLILRIKLSPRDEAPRIEMAESKPEKRNFLTCKIYIMDIERKSALCGMGEHIFLPTEEVEIWKFPQAIPMSKLAERKDRYFPNDSLSLRFEFGMSLGYKTTEIDNRGFFLSTLRSRVVQNQSRLNLLEFPCSLMDDLQSICKDGFLCDTNLLAGGQTFPAHRLILSARSPVFKAIFSTDMREKAGDSVDIEDIDAETMRRLLHFCYTDDVDNLHWNSVTKLYVAADKYSIEPLKDICSQMIVCSLSLSNVCDILALSDTHQDKDFQTAVHSYIMSNEFEVFGSDEWKELIEKEPQLAAETMRLKYTELKKPT